MQVQETTPSKIICKGCLRIITRHEINGKRVPCPICGSTLRHISDTVVCHIKAR